MQPMLTTLSRLEHIGTIPYAANTQANLATNGGLLPSNRFIESLILEFRGRLTMPAANGPTGVQASGHAGIIEQVTVEGYHRLRRANEKIIDLRGTDLELMQRFYAPSALMRSPATILTGANDNNDIVLQLHVPFTPQRMPSMLRAQYLLDAPNYESLKLTVRFGDHNSVIVPGATAPTFTAFGSGTGTPELRVYGRFAQDRNLFAGRVPGRVMRYFQEITGSLVTTSTTQARLYDIPRGGSIRSLMLKTGTKATNTTSGNNSYATHTEFLTNLRINQGLNNSIRFALNNDALFADLALSYNVSRVTGVGIFDFAPNGMPSETLKTRQLIAGPAGQTDLYLTADVAGSANQALTAIVEEWRFAPVSA